MFGFQKGYDSRREHIYTIGFYKRMSTLKIAKRNRRIETLPFDELKPSEKRIKVFHEQNGCCAICKLDKWLGKAITLAFHHKDGNKQNEARHNVEYLCPNCHSQTDHYGTKNLTKKQRERLSLGVRNAYKNGKYASVAHR